MKKNIQKGEIIHFLIISQPGKWSKGRIPTGHVDSHNIYLTKEETQRVQRLNFQIRYK